jgi:tryptophan halogenase
MNILVLGAGTAGWIAALCVQRALGDAARITVVGSTEVGIIGVGEGTTPQFVTHFLDEVGIPLTRLVAEAGCTLKSTVRFVDWAGPGSIFHHPFGDLVTPHVEIGLTPPGADRPTLMDVSYLAANAEDALVPWTPKHTFEQDPAANPVMNLIKHGVVAVHFDARQLAALLERVGRERGIQVVDDRVVEVLGPPAGHVQGIRLASGAVLPCNLLFDATGFARLVVGRHYGAPWQSCTSFLPNNRVIPFVAPLTGPVRPVTDAFAMSAGWTWRIPTQTRYGMGYVFDRNFIDDDSARAEILRRFPDAGDLTRAFDFEPGYFSTIWHHNVLAVGLASHFFEPIEATSIWLTVLTVREFLDRHLAIGDARSRDDFHRWWRTLLSRVVDFLHIHYLTPRTDTPFWRTFRARAARPPGVQALLGEQGFRWNDYQPPELAGHPEPFPYRSWSDLATGLHLWDDSQLHKLWGFRGLAPGFPQRLADRRQKIRAFNQANLTHAAAIEHLGGLLQVQPRS